VRQQFIAIIAKEIVALHTLKCRPLEKILAAGGVAVGVLQNSIADLDNINDDL